MAGYVENIYFTYRVLNCGNLLLNYEIIPNTCVACELRRLERFFPADQMAKGIWPDLRNTNDVYFTTGNGHDTTEFC